MTLSDVSLSDVWRLSVAYIGPTERHRKTKIGTEVAHVTRDSDTTFKVKRSRSQGAGAYCGGLPPIACYYCYYYYYYIIIIIISFNEQPKCVSGAMESDGFLPAPVVFPAMPIRSVIVTSSVKHPVCAVGQKTWSALLVHIPLTTVHWLRRSLTVFRQRQLCVRGDGGGKRKMERRAYEPYGPVLSLNNARCLMPKGDGWRMIIGWRRQPGIFLLFTATAFLNDWTFPELELLLCFSPTFQVIGPMYCF